MYFDNHFITINQRSQLRCEFFFQYAKWNEYATNKQERFSVSIMEKARETWAYPKKRVNIKWKGFNLLISMSRLLKWTYSTPLRMNIGNDAILLSNPCNAFRQSRRYITRSLRNSRPCFSLCGTEAVALPAGTRPFCLFIFVTIWYPHMYLFCRLTPISWRVPVLRPVHKNEGFSGSYSAPKTQP